MHPVHVIYIISLIVDNLHVNLSVLNHPCALCTSVQLMADNKNEAQAKTEMRSGKAIIRIKERGSSGLTTTISDR